MDPAGRPLGVLAAPDRPRPRLLRAGGEERDQVEQPVGRQADPVECGLLDPEVVQERLRLVGGELGQLGLDLGVDRDAFGVPRSRGVGRPAAATASGLPLSSTLATYRVGLAVSRSTGSGISTAAERAGRPCPARPSAVSSAACSATASLSPLLAVLADPLSRRSIAVLVGQDQLQLDRLGVVQRIDPAGRVGHGLVLEAAHHVEHRIGRSDAAEELVSQPLAVDAPRTRPAMSTTCRVAGTVLAESDSSASWRSRGSRTSATPVIALDGREHVRSDDRAAAGERVEHASTCRSSAARPARPRAPPSDSPPPTVPPRPRRAPTACRQPRRRRGGRPRSTRLAHISRGRAHQRRQPGRARGESAIAPATDMAAWLDGKRRTSWAA